MSSAVRKMRPTTGLKEISEVGKIIVFLDTLQLYVVDALTAPHDGILCRIGLDRFYIGILPENAQDRIVLFDGCFLGDEATVG